MVALGQGAFEHRGDGLLHVRRRHAAVGGEDDDDRHLEGGQNVGGRAVVAKDAQDEDEQHADPDGVEASEAKLTIRMKARSSRCSWRAGGVSPLILPQNQDSAAESGAAPPLAYLPGVGVGCLPALFLLQHGGSGSRRGSTMPCDGMPSPPAGGSGPARTPSGQWRRRPARR